MKNFSRRGFLIANSTFEMKLVYTFFLCLTFVGFITIVTQQFFVIGWGVEAIRQHYLGGAVELSFPKSFLELLGTSHAHAFMMGLIYLTLAHIIVATRIAIKTQQFFIIVGFVVTALDILLPWGVRYLSPLFAVLFIPTWIGEWIVYLGFIVIPLYDMWKPNGNDLI